MACNPGIAQLLQSLPPGGPHPSRAISFYCAAPIHAALDLTPPTPADPDLSGSFSPHGPDRRGSPLGRSDIVASSSRRSFSAEDRRCFAGFGGAMAASSVGRSCG